MTYQYCHTVQYSYTGKMYIQEIQKGCDTRKGNEFADTEVNRTCCISAFRLSL